MMALFRYKPLIFGLALIILTNVIVITGALGNRAGEPDAALRLSERELSLRTWGRKENSGISLNLNIHRNYYRGYSDRDNWLIGDKLKELGFKLIESEKHDETNRYVRKTLPKEVYIVLEFNGDAYRDAVVEAEEKRLEQENLLRGQLDSKEQQAELEAAELHLSRTKYSLSRLFAIDAGLEPEALRQQYPDKAKYIITSGMVKLSTRYDSEEKKSRIRGYISKIHITDIHVPLEHRMLFDNLSERERGENNVRLPRYRVELAYGQRYEPWVVSVEDL
ncbi:MAG: DUF4824 family protein [Pseudomonadota bacterium]